jgi:hypothetical protein
MLGYRAILLSIAYTLINISAKDIRLEIHVYANDTNQAIREAFTAYLKARQTARDNKITLAPVEGNNNK